MNPFKNQLNEIRHQNDEELWDIQSATTRGKVLRMTRYLSSASIPLFLIEEIKKDVIGIALEAEQEGVSIEEKLGLSVKYLAASCGVFDPRGSRQGQACLALARCSRE